MGHAGLFGVARAVRSWAPATGLVLLSSAGVCFARASFAPFVSHPISPAGPRNTVTVTVGDFNADGVQDIAAGFNAADNQTPARVGVLLGTGGGNFGPPTVFDPGVGCWLHNIAEIQAADFNNDLKLDLVMTEGGSGNGCTGNLVTVQLGDGAGGFASPGLVFATGGSDGNIAVGDLDVDGNLDLVVAGRDDNAMFVYLGLGNGTFTPNGGVPGFYSDSPFILRDLNGDGLPDLAAAFRNQNAVRVAFGSAQGGFFPPVSLPVNTPFSVGAADVNEDGTIDLVATSAGSGTHVLLGTGGGTFAADLISGAAIAGTSATIVADFDADGHLDIATHSAPAGAVFVATGGGDGTFGSSRVFSVGGTGLNTFFGALRGADLNGDNRTDLVAATVTQGGVSVLLQAVTTAWKNASSGNWFDAAKWDHGVPGPADDAVITAAGPSYTVTLSSPASVHSLILGDVTGTHNLDITNTTFTMAGACSLRSSGKLTLTNGTIAGTGSLHNEGILRVLNTSVVNTTVSTGPTSSISIEGQGGQPGVNGGLTVNTGFINQGTIELRQADSGNADAILVVTNGSLVNAPNGVIRAVSGIGARTLGAQIDNRGSMVLDRSLTIKAPANHINRGVIEVTGGDLDAGSSSFVNSGTITIAGNRRLNFDGGTFTTEPGGTVRGAGTLVVTNNGTISGDTLVCAAGSNVLLDRVTIDAPFKNRGTTIVQGTTAMNRTVELLAGSFLFIEGRGGQPGVAAALTVATGFTNQGSIELRLANAGDNTDASLVITNGTLVNAPSGIVSAMPGLGGRTLRAQVDNQGRILLEHQLDVDRTAADHVSSGTIDVTGGNLVVTAASTFTTSGILTIDGGRRVDFTGGLFTNAAGGIIRGTGTLAAGIAFANNGTLSPGFPRGILSVNGNCPFSSTSDLGLEIAGTSVGTEYDQLAVSGTVTLGGTLNVAFAPGFCTAAGNEFRVVSAGVRVGRFDAISVTGHGNAVVDTLYDGTGLTLRTVANNLAITATAGPGGRISPSDTTVVCGGDQTFTITPDSCFSVTDVLVDGISVGAVRSHTFNTVLTNHTIAANFAPVAALTITASAGPGGTIGPSGAVSVACGTDRTFVITPDPGGAIADVVADGASVGAVAAYTFRAIAADHTIAATFSSGVCTSGPLATQLAPLGAYGLWSSQCVLQVPGVQQPRLSDLLGPILGPIGESTWKGFAVVGSNLVLDPVYDVAQGYWINSVVALPGDFELAGTAASAPTASLTPGWNILGAPNSSGSTGATFCIEAHNRRFSIAEAVDSALVAPVAFDWRDTSGDLVNNGAFIAADLATQSLALEAGSGRLVLAYEPVRFLYECNFASRSHEPPTPAAVRTAPLWTLDFSAQSGRHTARGARVGAALGASEGRDAWDWPHPPLPGASALTIAIEHGDWGRFAGDYLRSIQASEQEECHWIVTVSGAGDRVGIECSGVESLPAGRHAYFLLPSGVAMPLQPGSTFVTPASGGRVRVELVVTSGPWNGPTVQSGFEGLIGVTPSPRQSGHILTYQLLAPGRPELRIFDITGRLVKDFGPVTGVAGTHRVDWNDRTSQGRRVAAGIYFAQLVLGPRSSRARVVVVH